MISIKGARINPYKLRQLYKACATTDARSSFSPARRVTPPTRPLVVAQHDMEDHSDILGGRLNIARHDTSLSWTELTPTRILFYTLMTTTLAFAVHFLYPYYRQFQEKRYRKSVFIHF